MTPGNSRLRKENGGGPLYDIGVYCINAARYLFRAEPEEVFSYSATGDDKRFSEIEEMSAVLMRFPGERLACLLVALEPLIARVTKSLAPRAS